MAPGSPSPARGKSFRSSGIMTPGSRGNASNGQYGHGEGTKYLDPQPGPNGRRALPSVRIGDHVLVRLCNMKHSELLKREERKAVEDARVRRLHAIDAQRMLTYQFLSHTPDIFYDACEQSNMTGVIPTAYVWLA